MVVIATVMIAKEVEVPLNKVRTEDLLEELKSRTLSTAMSDADVAILIKRLKESDCPEQILAPLREFLRGPVPTKEMLATWLESCGVTPAVAS